MVASCQKMLPIGTCNCNCFLADHLQMNTGAVALVLHFAMNILKTEKSKPITVIFSVIHVVPKK